MTNPNQNQIPPIPRTAEELDGLRAGVSGLDSKKTLEKAYQTNEKIERARKMSKMFQLEEFQEFWRIMHDEMKNLINTSVPQIKGTPAKDQRYDPLGQLVQLNNIQGGLEMLESQEIQKKIIEETAKADIIKTEELEAKLKAINNQ